MNSKAKEDKITKKAFEKYVYPKLELCLTALVGFEVLTAA
jgi:hypothetical protein